MPRTAATTRRPTGHPVRDGDRLQATVKTFGTSDEAVTLMKDRRLRRGLRLRGRLAAVDRVRRRRPGEHVAGADYPDIASFLKDKSWNSVNGQAYAAFRTAGAPPADVPHHKVNPARVVASVFTRRRQIRRQVTAYDSPIYSPTPRLF